ncbi:MAG: 5,10-methylenetetrahydromethanopterin reductase [Nitrososphaerales archaeon]
MKKFGLEFVPMEYPLKTVLYAQLAERENFDYLWITDHYNNRNVYVILSSIALNTNRIRFGPGVTNPYLIHPVITAQIIASLNELAPNRIMLGIGAGDKATLDMILGDRPKPLESIREAVTIIRSLLTENRVEFSGKAFNVKSARFNFKVEGKIPIFIGAQGPKMLELASSMGDGVLVNFSHPLDFERAMSSIKKGLEMVNKSIENLEVVAATSLSLDEDEKKAYKAAIPAVSFIVAGASEEILTSHNIDLDKAKAIREALIKAKWKDAFSNVSEDMVDAFSIAGKPNKVIERLSELFKLGVNTVIAGTPIGPNVKNSIELLSRKVMTYFKAS